MKRVYVVFCDEEELFETYSLKDAVDFCIRGGNGNADRHYGIKLDGTTIYEYDPHPWKCNIKN